MNVRKGAAWAILLGVFTGMVAPAAAQFGTARPPRSTPVKGGEDDTRKASVVFHVFPYSPFQYSYAFTDPTGAGQKAVAFNNGVLLATEVAFANAGSSRGGYALGGWYWSNTSNFIRTSFYDTESGTNPTLQPPLAKTVYELHGKYYFTPQLGVQLGYLDISGGGSRGSAYDYFLLYTFLSPRRASSGVGYTIQLGVGQYKQNIQTTATAVRGGEHLKDTYFTVFVNGSVEIAKNVTLDAVYWVLDADNVGQPRADSTIARFAIGVGYKL